MVERSGYFFALGAFFLWGIFPIYFKYLLWMEPLAIISHRGIWSFVFVAFILVFSGNFKTFIKAFSNGKSLLLTLAGALLISSNWFIFIYAVSVSKVQEASLGYFSAPLVSILIGFLILKEKLNKFEKIAVFLAFLGFLHSVIALNNLPLISLGLGVTFGLYGYVRKLNPHSTLVSFAIETLMLTPIFIGVFFWLNSQNAVIWSDSTQNIIFILASGFITATPLLFFASAAKRIPLVHLGLLNYITPCLQLLEGIFLFHEPFTGDKLITFSFIWAGLAVYSYQKLHFAKQRKRNGKIKVH